MITIDCANDEEIAIDLERYLAKQGHETKIDGSLVMIPNDIEIKKSLESFIKNTQKTGYDVLEADSETFVIAKVVSIEDFELSRCEMCGFVASEEELFAHRRAHGIGFIG
jgi:hypothetical protein